MADAACIVYTNDVCLKLQKKVFPQRASKMYFIETPFAFCEDTKENTEYSVGYFGSYSKTVRDIRPLYSLLSKAEYKSIIIGNGDIHIESSGNLGVLPRVPVDEISKYESKTDILICLCNKQSKGKDTGAIPGKAYHYGATTKRVLVVDASPAVKEFLSSYGRYTFADNNEESIKCAINELLTAENKEVTSMQEVMPERAAKKLIKIINEN